MKKPNQQSQITPNKSQLKKQCFDSETCESSVKDINSSKINTPNDKIPKKSIDIFPKKINIEKIDKNLEVYRKFTMENQLIIKDFVPQLKPIKIHIVPPKLSLNKKGFKDLKLNKKNKILLNSNKYFISCPNSEEESDDENEELYKEINKCESSNENININNYNNRIISNSKFSLEEKRINIDIKEIRKNLQKTKNRNIQKIYSKNNFIVKRKFDKDFSFDSSESDLYDIDEIDDYSLLEYEKDDKNKIKNENINDKNKNNKNRNRIHSFSILEMLQRKCQLDEE